MNLLTVEILARVLIFGGLCLVALIVVLATLRGKAETGVEGMIGKTGVVKTPLAPEGRVLAHGSLWTARVRGGASVPVGAKVRVLEVRGLELIVEPLPPEIWD